MWTRSIVFNFWAIFCVFFNSSWSNYTSNMLQIFFRLDPDPNLKGICNRIRIEMNIWIRIRQIFMRIHCPAKFYPDP